MDFIRIRQLSKKVHTDINRFLSQLTNEQEAISEDFLRAVIESDNTHLFFLYNEEQQPIGMITIVKCQLASGSKAWIEDVVVDSAQRGKGYGKLLVEYTIEYAKTIDVKTLMLTSNPSRIEANRLYQALNFEQYITNVYKLKII